MSKVRENDSGGDLLAQVAQGAERSMNHCIQEFAPLVWSIVRRHVRDQSAAEDVVQETFTDLWKSAKRFNPAMGTATTFVGLLARRRAIDYVRKESRQPQTEPLPEKDSLSQAAKGPSALGHCERGDVQDALQTLPEETRTIFSLHFNEGLTHPEIVEKTGLPLGTVKTRLRRGLIELRDKLRPENEGGIQTAPKS